jgi:hypothetical protein
MSLAIPKSAIFAMRSGPVDVKRQFLAAMSLQHKKFHVPVVFLYRTTSSKADNMTANSATHLLITVQLFYFFITANVINSSFLL